MRRMAQIAGVGIAALLFAMPSPAIAADLPVTTFGDVEVFASGLRDFEASTATSVVIASGADVGYAAIAASYAHRFSVPLVLLSAKASTKALVNAVAVRAAKAVLVGPPDAVPKQLESEFKAAKVKVVRLDGMDRAGTAALIATRIRPAESSTAVYVALGGDARWVTLASAYANARGLPLLAASGSLSRATIDAMTSLRLAGGVAIGDSRNIPDAILSRLPGVTRVIGKDLASTSFALARSLPPGSATLVIDRAADPNVLALVQRAVGGEPQLLLNDGALSTALQAWLTARGDITAIAATSSVSLATRTSVGTLIANRGAVGALPALAMKAAAPVAVPSAFTFSGSGFGHGVGMSQWGAYGMAKEGFSATAILQHYFAGSVVAPITDAVDVNVSLDARVQSESFRLEKIADPTSTLEMTAADGTVTLLAINDVVTTKYAGGKVNVTVTGATPVNPFSTTGLTLRWAGNRDSGTATGGPAVLRVAGPGVSIASGSRYRYGIVTVTPAKVSGALSLGLQVNNVLRLHDEYLYGIAEVSSSWPDAVLQSQVITARSFAYRKVKAGIRSACSCNVYDDPRDQNFTGYAKLAESNVGARWKAAVDGTLVSPTQGQMLTVGGQVVSAYYSAATGGMTQNNEDVWGGSPLAYTRSVDDHWSLTYASSSVTRWVPRSFSQAKVAAAFGAPDVAYLDFANRYASGAVDNAVAVSSTGQRFVIGAETLKSRLNAGLDDASVLAKGIPSVWMWRVDTDVPADRAADTAMQVAAGTTSIASGLASATSTTVVIVQEQTDTAVAAPGLAVAAAYAGAHRYGLLMNTGAGLDPAIKAELTRRKATKAILVGSVPPALTPALVALKIGATTVAESTPGALAVALAGPPVEGAPVVVAGAQDSAVLPLAVSLAVRLRQPLLLAESGVLAADVASYLLRAQPASMIVVGSADAVPDAAVAGFGVVSRLTTGSMRLASVIAASQVFDASTVGIAVVGVQSSVPASIVVAAAGLPMYYVEAPEQAPTPSPAPVATVTPSPSATPSPTPVATVTVSPTPAVTRVLATGPLPEEALALVQRLPALTQVFRLGVDPLVVTALRRA